MCSFRPIVAPFAVALSVASAVALASAAVQFSSGVNLVEVYTSVTDADGQPVTGLSRADFHVAEDGEPQTIAAFTAGDFPLSVAIAVDRSWSMGNGRLAAATSAARLFVGDLRPTDQAEVVSIGSEVQTVAPLSTNRDEQFRALASLDRWGTTPLYDAVIDAIDTIQGARGRRALVLLSDGDDRYSHASASDALQKARRSDVMIYAVALGDKRPPVFAELAAVTGGRSVYVKDPRDLPRILQTIARELRFQYLIGYTPTRPIDASKAAGEWRSITVTVITDRPNLQVRARDGYFAK